MFYGQVWLYCGNGEKAADYLYAFANHTSKGRCWREEQVLKGRQSSAIWGDMPHNWGSAEFIRLARNLIVLEKKDNLELLCGLPKEWLPTEQARLYLEDTPTKYGRITLEMTRERREYVLRVAMDLWRNPHKLILHWYGQGSISVPAVQSGNGWEMDGKITAFTAKLIM